MENFLKEYLIKVIVGVLAAVTVKLFEYFSKMENGTMWLFMVFIVIILFVWIKIDIKANKTLAEIKLQQLTIEDQQIAIEVLVNHISGTLKTEEAQADFLIKCAPHLAKGIIELKEKKKNNLSKRL